MCGYLKNRSPRRRGIGRRSFSRRPPATKERRWGLGVSVLQNCVDPPQPTERNAHESLRGSSGGSSIFTRSGRGFGRPTRANSVQRGRVVMSSTNRKKCWKSPPSPRSLVLLTIGNHPKVLWWWTDYRNEYGDGLRRACQECHPASAGVVELLISIEKNLSEVRYLVNGVTSHRHQSSRRRKAWRRALQGAFHRLVHCGPLYGDSSRGWDHSTCVPNFPHFMRTTSIGLRSRQTQ